MLGLAKIYLQVDGGFDDAIIPYHCCSLNYRFCLLGLATLYRF
jgi:hypothetical protein